MSIRNTPYLPRAREQGGCTDGAMSRLASELGHWAVSLLILRGRHVDTVNIAVCPVTARPRVAICLLTQLGPSACRLALRLRRRHSGMCVIRATLALWPPRNYNPLQVILLLLN